MACMDISEGVHTRDSFVAVTVALCEFGVNCGIEMRCSPYVHNIAVAVIGTRTLGVKGP